LNVCVQKQDTAYSTTILFTFALFTLLINSPIQPVFIEHYPVNVKEYTPMTTVSTELINYSGFTTANIASWTALCTAQGITEVTLRLPAYTDFLDGDLEYSWYTKTLEVIASLKAAGIDSNIDCHTWYTTWDTYFRDSATNSTTYRNTYKTWLTEVINSFDGVSGVKAFMVLNEPQARTASSSENSFIIELINLAQSLTSLPVSVRFMAGYSPSTGHYSSAIDLETDFLARNTYWDPRYPDTSVYGTTEAKMETDIDLATSLGKELWITEFGKTKTNVTEQKNYIEAFVTYAKNRSIDRIFAWASAPTDSTESYNLFNGWTPNPAWYTLDSSSAPANDTNLAPMFQNGVANCRWGDANLHSGNPYYGETQAGEKDDVVTSPNGYSSIKYYPSAGEIDNYFYPVKPGDHVIYIVWIKTGGTSATEKGARCGIDFYGNGYSLDGLPSGGTEMFNVFSATPYNPTTAPTASWSSTTGVASGYNVMYIRWGTSGWTQMKYDFIVPEKFYTKCYYVGEPYDIPATQIDNVIPWIDIRDVDAEGPDAWFSDSELYINPTSSPPDTVTITASSDAHCALNSEGSVTVAYGGSKTFSWTLDEGYIIDAITVDSAAVGNTGSYTFLNCLTNHTIAITAKLGSPPEVNIKAISQVIRRLNGE
jgi:hypothetical protein